MSLAITADKQCRKHGRKLFKAFTLSMLLGISQQSPAADNAYSVGLGIGALYSGIGINFASRTDNDFKYIGTGCTSISWTEHSGTSTRCGGSAGWLWSGVVSPTDRNHGFGMYFGPVELGQRNLRDPNIYGAGITYAYFTRGINRRGWTLGSTLAAGRENSATKFGLFLNAGYQF